MPKLFILGGHPSSDDLIDRKPFSGMSGKILDDLFKFAGISRADCVFSTVFRARPSQNDASRFFTREKNGNPRHSKFGYLLPQYLEDIQRLDAEIEAAQPDVIVPMGTLALWALTGEESVNEHRGVVQTCAGIKLVPTHHPDDAMRDWSLRPTIASDLVKAVNPGNTRTSRTVNIIESVADMREAVAAIVKEGFFAFDVETAAGQITCISLAVSPGMSWVIPFWNYTKADNHQFTSYDETLIWDLLRSILEDPAIRKLAHNATYDLSYCYEHNILTQGRVDDTMLMAHAYQIELPKSLGYLGSIYCNEGAWKLMRVGPKKDLNKPDE